MIRLAIDLIFAVAIALVVAYGLASVLREYTAVTWWQVLAVGEGGGVAVMDVTLQAALIGGLAGGIIGSVAGAVAAHLLELRAYRIKGERDDEKSERDGLTGSTQELYEWHRDRALKGVKDD